MTNTVVQAHRGAPDPASGITENTLAAFAHARRLGADGVELDARLTADGIVIVHHDPEIPGLGPIADLHADQLPPDVPTLADSLAICTGMIVNIEVKNTPGEPGFDPDNVLAREVARLAAGRVEVVVSSFWPDALSTVHQTVAEEGLPDLATGLLAASWFDPDQVVPVALARRCRAIHPHVSLISGVLVEQAHRAGLAVATWTVNDRTQLEYVSGLGVDTVITDDVSLALDCLGSRLS